VTNPFMTPDRALDHVRKNLEAAEGLVGNCRIQDLEGLDPRVLASALGCFLEAADVFGKLDRHMKEGGGGPSDWAVHS
jgi:hypothetical protein